MTVFDKKQMVKGLVTSLAFATFAYGMSVSAATYTLKSGDTLSQIAQAQQTTVDELAKLNKLDDVNLIFVGQTLELSSDIQLNQETSTTTTTTESSSTAYTSNLSEADAAAKEIIAFKESSGSYIAQNGQYYGRYQLSLSYLNGDLSPENQERVADAYVAGRYGSWSAALAFWQVNGWY